MAAATLLHLHCLTLNNILSTDKNALSSVESRFLGDEF